MPRRCPTRRSHARARRLTVVAAAVGTLLVARVASADDRRTADALLHDVRKLVGAQEDTGWLIDRYEIEDLMPDAIHSTCQVSVAARWSAPRRS